MTWFLRACPTTCRENSWQR